MKEALSRFKDTVKGEIRKALKVLRNDDDMEEVDTNKKDLANQEKHLGEKQRRWDIFLILRTLICAKGLVPDGSKLSCIGTCCSFKWRIIAEWKVLCPKLFFLILVSFGSRPSGLWTVKSTKEYLQPHQFHGYAHVDLDDHFRANATLYQRAWLAYGQMPRSHARNEVLVLSLWHGGHDCNLLKRKPLQGLSTCGFCPGSFLTSHTYSAHSPVG